MKNNNLKKLKTDIFWKGIPERAYSKKNGKIMHGHYINYYEDGSINSIGTWMHGKKEGAWQYFYENGLLFSRGFYRNDQKFPDEKSWEHYKESGERFTYSIHDEF